MALSNTLLKIDESKYHKMIMKIILQYIIKWISISSRSSVSEIVSASSDSNANSEEQFNSLRVDFL